MAECLHKWYDSKIMILSFSNQKGNLLSAKIEKNAKLIS